MRKGEAKETYVCCITSVVSICRKAVKLHAELGMNKYILLESQVCIWTWQGHRLPEEAVFMKKIPTFVQTVDSQAVLRDNTSEYHSSIKTHQIMWWPLSKTTWISIFISSILLFLCLYLLYHALQFTRCYIRLHTWSAQVSGGSDCNLLVSDIVYRRFRGTHRLTQTYGCTK